MAEKAAFRGQGEAFVEELRTRFGCKDVLLPGRVEGRIYLAEEGFTEAKGSGASSAWMVYFVQEGECFWASVPFSLPEEELAGLLKMERIGLK
jgi:hypothetical protein